MVFFFLWLNLVWLSLGPAMLLQMALFNIFLETMHLLDCFWVWIWPSHTWNSSSVQLLSCVWLFAIPWTAACQASLSITNSWSLLKLTSIELVMPSNHLILCCPLLLLPSTFPSIRVFSNESVLRIRWPKYWSLSFSISPSNEYSGLISFRMGWLDFLVVQGTLKSLLYPETHLPWLGGRGKATPPLCAWVSSLSSWGMPVLASQDGPGISWGIPTHHPRVYNIHSQTVTRYPANSIVVVGGCPVCRVGVLEDSFTFLGIFLAIVLFPFGFICCFALRKQRCPNCGANFT